MVVSRFPLLLIYVGKFSLFFNTLAFSFVLFNYFLNFAPVFKDII